MNRREAIKKTGLMLGFAVSSPALLHVLQGCTTERALNWQPLIFNKEQATLVSEIVNQILPKTDSPGAVEVGVDVFVDKMVAEVYSKKEQQQFLKGLDDIDADVKAKKGELFKNLNDEEKYQYLYELDSQLKGLSYSVPPEGKPFFLMIKELSLLGYFTSEEIMKNHLDYMPLPMKLVGCEPMEANQKLRVGNYF